jgi:hypothetical protein
MLFRRAQPEAAAAAAPAQTAVPTSVLDGTESEKVRKVKLAVQKYRTDAYRIALRMKVSGHLAAAAHSWLRWAPGRLGTGRISCYGGRKPGAAACLLGPSSACVWIAALVLIPSFLPFHPLAVPNRGQHDQAADAAAGHG